MVRQQSTQAEPRCTADGSASISAQHTPGPKFSEASVRRDVSEALRPLRLAIHAALPDEKLNVPTATLYGFRFTGCRYYRGRSSRFAWYADYTGENTDGVRISGGIAEVASSLYWHFRRAAIAKATGSAA